MEKTSKKSKIEPVHIEEAARLKALFEARSTTSQMKFGADNEIGSQGMVWQYLNARAPLNLDAALKFAKGLGCAVSDFSPRLAEALQLFDKLKELQYFEREQSNAEPGPELSGRVPLISWVQAGDWANATDLLQPGEAFEWVRTTVTVQTNTYALRVTGDSMEPDFPAGMILVVEPEMDAHPGDFVIVKNGDDEATFKQLVRDGADLYLKPLNPRYPIKPLGSSKIVGVVREAVRKLR